MNPKSTVSAYEDALCQECGTEWRRPLGGGLWQPRPDPVEVQRRRERGRKIADELEARLAVPSTQQDRENQHAESGDPGDFGAVGAVHDRVPLWYWTMIPLWPCIGVVVGLVAVLTGSVVLYALAGVVFVGFGVGRGIYYASLARVKEPVEIDPVEALHERYATSDMLTEDFERELGELMGLAYNDGDERTTFTPRGVPVEATPSPRPSRASRGDGQAASP